MSEIPKKYTIDNAKNDIQNLQAQNSYDFQEIKRLGTLIKEYDKRILQSINFNNLINKKIQSQISLINELNVNIQTQITTILDRIKHLEDNLSNELNVNIQTQITTILDRIKHLEDNLSNEDSKPIVLCKNAGLSLEDGQETESKTRIATDFIPVTVEGDLTIYSETLENYKYLVRYYDVNKRFISVAGGDWALDGRPIIFTPIEGVNFEDVKFIRLVYKSNYSDNDVINTINGTIEVEEDGNIRTLQMQK